ncbi:MAG TPA: nucleoside-diphosphate sugar epimerase/dehydratase [Flavitalea sp.]|nr:nucleoside-diphosphate sugar epimerase/dehydratase [Flavitalea sp.]
MKKLLLNATVLPRWVILLVDLFISGSSFALSYFVVKQFDFPAILRGHFFFYTGLYCLVSGVVFYLMRVHTGLIRYSNIKDMLRIFLSVFVTSLVYPIAVQFIMVNNLNIASLSISTVLFINFFVASTMLVMLRTAVKELYNYVKRNTTPDKENILIYGADNNSILLKQAMESGNAHKFLVAGFLEANNRKINTYIQQKKVYHLKELTTLKEKKNIEKLILMNEQLTSIDKKLVIEKCLQLGIQVLTVPPSDQWMSGKLSSNQIQALKIEDLLQREPIVINNSQVSKDIAGKRVLVTGAAGSIGSEIVRQVLSYDPEMVILCDQAESDLHEMQLDVEEKFPGIKIRVFIGNIREYKRMETMFNTYRPQIVFHAAAYKHVPMMEHHPSEAILTNVMGTKNLADLAVAYNSQKFVMISTDKAVNPTNIMGTSKRIAEMYVQSLSSSIGNEHDANGFNHNSNTRFITTRFGNVLGSNGSVIPRFREQIQKGGPVTVTDPEITRFFMTIPEAVQLVLEAGTMGTGGEIFIFDMGKPVRIVDLAKKMIRIAGLVPDEDIRIVYTGLRTGEKLYEELLNKEEKTLPTHHEKIKIARVIPCSWQTRNDIEDLIELCTEEDNEELVREMKRLVPEFKSKNSKYEKLDNNSYAVFSDMASNS